MLVTLLVEMKMNSAIHGALVVIVLAIDVCILAIIGLEVIIGAEAE